MRWCVGAPWQPHQYPPRPRRPRWQWGGGRQTVPHQPPSRPGPRRRRNPLPPPFPRRPCASHRLPRRCHPRLRRYQRLPPECPRNPPRFPRLPPLRPNQPARPLRRLSPQWPRSGKRPPLPPSPLAHQRPPRHRPARADIPAGQRPISLGTRFPSGLSALARAWLIPVDVITGAAGSASYGRS